MESYSNMTLNKIKGAIYFALIGDSIGSDLEFSIDPSKTQIHFSLEMNGSRVHKTGPGQITDDGEMILALGRSLKKGKNIDYDIIADNYGKWAKSKPFDIGNTIRNAVFKATSDLTIKGKANLMYKASTKSNSKSNGSLMRVLPLSIYIRNYKNEEIINSVDLECRLTHSNLLVRMINLAYSCIIITILRSDNTSLKPNELLSRAHGFYNNLLSLDKHNPFTCYKDYDECKKEISELFSIAEKEDPTVILDMRHIGYIKVAFGLTLNIFCRNLNFRDSLSAMLSYGGDTDTNCCILGGLVGCYLGFDILSSQCKSYIDILMNFDPKQKNFKGKKRPEEFIPKYNIDNIVENLI